MRRRFVLGLSVMWSRALGGKLLMGILDLVVAVCHGRLGFGVAVVGEAKMMAENMLMQCCS
jgi:hypothetical protein